MLRPFLQAMLDDAVRKPGGVVRKRFTKGLHIALMVTEKSVQISLSRDKVYPSEREWQTVLAHFPYIVPKVEPIKFVDGLKRFAMRGKLPRREDVPEQLAFSGKQLAISEEPKSDENSEQ